MYSVNDKYEALIMSYLDGQCTSEEACELLSWVAESEENRLYFKALKDQNEVWSLTDFALPEFDEAEVEAALDAVNAKIDALEEEANVVQMPWLRKNYRYVSGVAAAFLIALFVGFLVRNPFNSTVTPELPHIPDPNNPCCVTNSTSKSLTFHLLISSLNLATISFVDIPLGVRLTIILP